MPTPTQITNPKQCPSKTAHRLICNSAKGELHNLRSARGGQCSIALIPHFPFQTH